MNNPCVIPKPAEDNVGDGRWLSMHNRYVSETKQNECEILFIGDSIIQQLQLSSLWKDKITLLHCLNFGIGGDTVENVLWRVQNGELDFTCKIKAVVLFVGTNNVDCTPREVFEGILEIIKEIKKKLGKVLILLPTLLPRGEFPNPLRERNDHVNTFLIDRFHNNMNIYDHISENVHVVQIHENILSGNQTISHYIMPDYLHLSKEAYNDIFSPVYYKLKELLDAI